MVLLACLIYALMLQLFGRPQWLTVKNRSHCYVNKVLNLLKSKDNKIIIQHFFI